MAYEAGDGGVVELRSMHRNISPLHHIIICAHFRTGKGDVPAAGVDVLAHYTGKLMDGTVFDSSVKRGKPFSFTLGAGMVIEGECFTLARQKLHVAAGRLCTPGGYCYQLHVTQRVLIYALSPAAWDVGIATMKPGEKAVFTCAPGVAYGARGAPPVIPPNATLVFEVELLGSKPAEGGGCSIQ